MEMERRWGSLLRLEPCRGGSGKWHSRIKIMRPWWKGRVEITSTIEANNCVLIRRKLTNSFSQTDSYCLELKGKWEGGGIWNKTEQRESAWEERESCGRKGRDSGNLWKQQGELSWGERWEAQAKMQEQLALSVQKQSENIGGSGRRWAE